MDANVIRGRLEALHRRMREEDVSLYLVTTSDFHMSESPAPYFATLEYISGFTGSEGKMIITAENAHLWTDGRYTLQAAEELAGTGITLHIYSDFSDDIRTLPMFFSASGEAFFDAIVDKTSEGGFVPHELKTVVGCDGRTVSFDLMDEIIDSLGIAFDSGAVMIDAKLDLVGDIWQDRPALPCERVELLDEQDRGGSTKEKLTRVRAVLGGFGPDTAAVVTSLDDIAWLFNIRGRDMAYDLTTLAYSYVTDESAYLFIDRKKVPGRVRDYLESSGVTIRGYNEFYSFLEKADNHFIVVDPERNNAAVVVTIGDKRDAVMLNHEGIVADIKAVKSTAERRNSLEIHLTDAAVMIKFIKWLKDNVGKVRMTELSAGNYLDLLREKAGAICPSFPTICAYGAHAAICHYVASAESDAAIEAAGLLLVDSGGHYRGGTTDTTRTVVMGPLSEEMKRDYTLALCGMLELMNAVFPEGLLDSQLDVFARKPMWKYGIEFDHGTGHGVGHMLTVQEGPQAITWRKGNRGVKMRAGMITTDEPGVYRDGKYGIRHENELLCRPCDDMPGYLNFIPLTFVPIDTEGVDKRYMTAEQLAMLNEYNAMVFHVVSPMLDEEHRAWLTAACAPIQP